MHAAKRIERRNNLCDTPGSNVFGTPLTRSDRSGIFLPPLTSHVSQFNPPLTIGRPAVPKLRPIGDRAHRSGAASPHAATRLPWMNTIASLRRLCVVWIAAVLWMAFQPLPSPAQPGPVRTAMKPAAEGLLAQTPFATDGPVGVPTNATNAFNLAGPPPKILVLHNGRIVDGRISQNAGGYMIEKPNGSMLVPFDRVQFGAQNRVDAYHKLRERITTPTSDALVGLARWCLAYQLYDEAAEQLREALERNPENGEARSILQKLEDLRNPERPIHRTAARTAPRTDDDFELPEVESLGGFSRHTAQEFITQIQPLLINKCGNASCHGGLTRREGFALSPGRSNRGARVFAERNLAAVVKYVDFETPDRSELLLAPRGAHGGARSVFFGTKGGEQAESLRQWVRTAAAEQRAQRRSAASRPVLTQGDSANRASEPRSVFVDSAVIPASAQEEDSFQSENSPKSAETRPQRVETAKHAFESTDRLTKTLRESQPDPFDPTEFNRKATRPTSP